MLHPVVFLPTQHRYCVFSDPQLQQYNYGVHQAVLGRTSRLLSFHYSINMCGLVGMAELAIWMQTFPTRLSLSEPTETTDEYRPIYYVSISLLEQIA
jgi:hypothetical protein